MRFYSKFLEQKNLDLIQNKYYSDDLDYLKDVIFIKSLVYVYSLSIFVLIPGIIYGISINNLLVVFWDVVTYIIIFVLVYPSKVKLSIRKWIFVSSIYLLGFQLLYELGMDGAGILFWIIGNITSSLIFNKIQLLFVTIVNTIVFLYVGYIIYYGLTPETFSKSLSLYDWLIITIHNIYLSFIISSILNELLAVLKRVLLKEKKLQFSVENTVENILISNNLLKKKNVQLEQIAYVTAKELKEPLAIVANNLEAVAKNIADNLDEKGAKYLYFAHEGAERMSLLIDGMVKLAKIDQHIIQFDEIRLEELIIEQFNAYNTINEKARLIMEIPGNLFISDKLLITKLFNILFSNSFNYRKKNTELIIQINLMEVNDDTWELSFTDNGIGIDDIYFERVFQIYQRLHKNNEYPGQGIGLALAKRIISKLNGQINIESKKDIGTTLTFNLPKIKNDELD
jgi:signal transduction histidine kinase